MSEIKIYIYKILTPVIDNSNNAKLLRDYFDFNIINFCIKTKMTNCRLKRIKTFEKSKTIVLENYNDDNNNEFAYGEFLTISHGVKATSVEIENLTKTKDFTEKEGILNKVKFIIDKNNGNLFIEKDRNSVMNMSRLKQYFDVDKEKKLLYIENFNKIHNNFLLDTKKRLFNLTLLQPLPFIEQLRKIKNVEDIEVPININVENKQKTGLVSNLRRRANKNNIGNHKTTIVLSDFDQKKLSEELLKFIEYLIANHAYENPKIRGSIGNNITRVFTPETSTRDMIIDVNVDINGWINMQEMLKVIELNINEDDQLNTTINKKYTNQTDLSSLIKRILKLNLIKNTNKDENISYKLKKISKSFKYKIKKQKYKLLKWEEPNEYKLIKRSEDSDKGKEGI